MKTLFDRLWDCPTKGSHVVRGDACGLCNRLIEPRGSARVDFMAIDQAEAGGLT